MLFVTGGNGHFARSVIGNLQALGLSEQLVVGTRNPGSDHARALADQGITVRLADFDRPETLAPAMAGAERVLIIPTIAPNDVRPGQNRNALEAAKAVGARHVVYPSFINAGEDSHAEHSRLVHYPMEQAIKGSGLEFTILRHALYAEIMVGDLAETLRSGRLQRAGGAARCAYIARDDLGASAALVLARAGHEGRTYTETMARTYSGEEVARLIGEVFGAEVSYSEVSAEDWPRYMIDHWGVPPEAANSSMGTMRAVSSGEFDIASPDYEAITGRPPLDFRQFLESVRDRV